MNRISPHNLFKRSSVILLVWILVISYLIPSLILAQEEPISYPAETPVSFPQDSSNTISPEESNAIDSTKDKLEGYTDEEINDATAKVRDALIVPAENNFFVVKFKDENSAERVSQEVAPDDVIPNRYTSLLGEDIRLIKINNDQDKIDQMTRFNLDDSVEYVETNQIVKQESWTTTSTTAKPSDFNNANHWYHVKTKLAETYKDQGCPDTTICGGSSSIIVAVLDTGMAFETNTGATYREYLGGSSFIDRTPLNFTPSPELTGISLWTNPSENYIGHDEDGNFVCDDLHGADMIAVVDNLSLLNSSQWSDECNNGTSWVKKEGHPNDDDGHGTYVINMIASLVDNATSSFGAAFKTQIMPIKVLDYTGTGTTFTIAQGIRYAVNKGAKIINISIAGLTSPSATLEDAISYANSHNVLIIVSSGNQALSSLEYPSAYTNSYSNVIAVGASNTSDTRASYSSYGTGLDLVAPVGTGASAGNAAFGQTFNDADSWNSTPVISRDFTTYANKYWIGTSFSAPQVTSAAALLWGEYVNLNPLKIKTYLRSSATDIGAAGYDTQTGYGILNVKLARDQLSLIGYPWVQSGPSKDLVFMASSSTRFYESSVDATGAVRTRSTDGTMSGNNLVWTPWIVNGHTSTGQLTMSAFGDMIFQSTVDTGLVYTRYTIGNLDGSGFPVWSDWILAGPSKDTTYMATQGSRFYQSSVDASGVIRTRSTDGSLDGSSNVIWTRWVVDGQTTTGQMSMSGSVNKLFQSYVNSGLVYTRYTTNVLDGGGLPTWSSWRVSGPSKDTTYMESLGNRFFQTSLDPQGNIRTRSADVTSATFPNDLTWTPWIVNGQTTNNFMTMKTSNGKIYQSVVVSTHEYTRFSSGILDGSGFPYWSAWTNTTETSNNIYMENYNNRLYQATTLNGLQYTRSTDGTFNLAGTDLIWTSWVQSGLGMQGKVFMGVGIGKLFQSTVNNQVVWTRYFSTS